MVSSNAKPKQANKGILGMSEQSHIYVEEHGDVAVVRFEDRKIIDELVIQELGSELMALVDEQNRMKIVLNFENVEFLSSAALGKLILLDKRAKEAGPSAVSSGSRKRAAGVGRAA